MLPSRPKDFPCHMNHTVIFVVDAFKWKKQPTQNFVLLLLKILKLLCSLGIVLYFTRSSLITVHIISSFSLTGMNLSDCFKATGAYQQESLKKAKRKYKRNTSKVKLNLKSQEYHFRSQVCYWHRVKEWNKANKSWKPTNNCK